MSMTTMTISLPESHKASVDHKEEDARLEALLLEGLLSGEDIPVTEKFWRDLKTEAVQIARKRKAEKKA